MSTTTTTTTYASDSSTSSTSSGTKKTFTVKKKGRPQGSKNKVKAKTKTVAPEPKTPELVDSADDVSEAESVASDVSISSSVSQQSETKEDESAQQVAEMVADAHEEDESAVAEATKEDESAVDTEEEEVVLNETEPTPYKAPEFKALAKLGATYEELAKYHEAQKVGAYTELDQRGLDLLEAESMDKTVKGDRTDRCSFQFKIKISKQMLKTIQHNLTPSSSKSKQYTDTAIKTAMNQYFYDKINCLYAMELCGETENIYSKKNGEEGKVISSCIKVGEDFFEEVFCDGYLHYGAGRKILDAQQNIHEQTLSIKVGEDFFEEVFCDGYLHYGAGRGILDAQQNIHEQTLSIKRKSKNKKSQKEEAKSFLDEMTEEARNEFLAKYMNK